MIGILAGMGPRSTGPFLDLIFDECQKQYGARDDIDFPKMMICSQPAPFYEDRPIDHFALEAAIREGLLDLEKAGADFLAIACNTAHIYYQELASAVGVPLLNMVELAATAISGAARTAALIAARPTAESGVYQAAFERRGIETIDLGWQSDVDRLLGLTRTTTDASVFTQRWAGLTDRAHEAQADILVVACLDLSGVLHFAQAAIQIFDAARSLAKEIVAEWLRRQAGDLRQAFQSNSR